ncbi:MAG: asparaginase [Ilumatobacteraceae bacterium]
MTRFDGAIAPIAVTTRSGFEESVHHGAGVAVAASGEATATVGDADLVVYPRSSLKPMQAHAMVAAGLELPDELLAVACASHDGADVHLDAVRAILDRFDLVESDLQNTPTRPLDSAARTAAREAGIGPSSLQQNCSGKHAAMLATCRVNGWSIDTYLDVDHPLQQAITAGFERLGCTVHHIGIDGCGAPTHALSLSGLAGAFSTIATDGTPVARSMRANPVLVAGLARDTTRWMQAVPGLMTKDGADGVMAGALADGRSFAYKIADGSDLARESVMSEAMSRLGVDVAGLAPDLLSHPVLGHGREVGQVRALEWVPCSS